MNSNEKVEALFEQALKFQRRRSATYFLQAPAARNTLAKGIEIANARLA